MKNRIQGLLMMEFWPPNHDTIKTRKFNFATPNKTFIREQILLIFFKQSHFYGFPEADSFVFGTVS